MGLSAIKGFSLKDKAEVIGLLVGGLSLSLIRKVVTTCFQRNLGVDKAVIGFTSGGKIGGYTLHIVDRESVNYECDVTDYYIDTNRAVCDHIAWKPVTITLQGKVGRYYHDITKDVSNSLMYYRVFNQLSAFIPKIPGVRLERKIRSAISSATSKSGIVNILANSLISFSFGVIQDKLRQLGNEFFYLYEDSAKIEDEQTNAFLYFEELWRLGMPVTVTTTWKIFENMVITSLKPSRDENGDVTEFNITLKQISTVSSIVVDDSKKVSGGNTANQKATVIDKGKTNGIEVTSVPTDSLKFN